MINNINIISNQLKSLDRLQNKLNFQLGGQKLQYGSDDPLLYSKLLGLDNDVKKNDNILLNLTNIKGYNNASDIAMKNIKDTINKINSELIKANSSTNNLNDLDNIANSLITLKDTLLNLSFNENEIIFDQDGKEWILNKDTNRLESTTWNGVLKTLEVFKNSENKYEVKVPNENGKTLESKRNLFDTLNNSINSLKGLDQDGNKVSNDPIEDYNFRVEGIRKNINEFQEIFDNINLQHSNLGYKNRMIEEQIETISDKNLNIKTTRSELGDSNLVDVTIKLKELEITYAAIYSSINRTFELSLVNFLK